MHRIQQLLATMLPLGGVLVWGAMGLDAVEARAGLHITAVGYSLMTPTYETVLTPPGDVVETATQKQTTLPTSDSRRRPVLSEAEKRATAGAKGGTSSGGATRNAPPGNGAKAQSAPAFLPVVLPGNRQSNPTRRRAIGW